MKERRFSCARDYARAADVRDDYEEFKLLVDRLVAVLDHQKREIERMITRDASLKPEVALTWRAGHDLVEQGVAELNALRQRIGLRIQEALSAVHAHERQQPIQE